jgi:SAM-dependent methyltransferase
MHIIRRLLSHAHPFRRTSWSGGATEVYNEVRLLTEGWDGYARNWRPEHHAVLSGRRVEHLGDEWTIEDPAAAGSCYGLPAEAVSNFDQYLSRELLGHLPESAGEGLELGPGGGRLTALLIPRTSVLHLAEPSGEMLNHLQQRFAQVPNVRYYQTDGQTLPPLPARSLDYFIAFDVCVHFEPRLLYWYLCQIPPLLKPGGTGIIHYANALTPLGWQQFETQLEANLKRRTFFGAFGVMCPQLMEKFLESLGLEIVSCDTRVIPRDAVAVFRRRAPRDDDARL